MHGARVTGKYRVVDNGRHRCRAVGHANDQALAMPSVGSGGYFLEQA